MPTPILPAVRFWRLVDRSDPDGCWLWLGTTGGTRSTYGYFRSTTSQHDPKVLAHRFAYELEHGPIPDGLQVDHLCRVTLCVRPSHLEAVTAAENARRTRLDRCARGHDLNAPGVANFDARGRRRGCRQCNREKALERYYRLRAQEV